MEPIADNETEHMILAGSILAVLVGAVGYAAHHNQRHRYEFDFLQDQINLQSDSLDQLVPGFERDQQELKDRLRSLRPSSFNAATDAIKDARGMRVRDYSLAARKERF